MLREESDWIQDVLKETDLSTVKEVLDVGSSTEEFRTRTQPYIDENIFRPLRNLGLSICHLDKKAGAGIDLVCDIENTQPAEIGRQFDLVICTSLLEHVHDPVKLSSLLVDLVRQGGFLLVTVPQVYRYHADPIDTMFRPAMPELISMLPGMQVIHQAVIRIRDKDKYNVLEFIRYVVPFLNWRVNCLFMRKN